MYYINFIYYFYYFTSYILRIRLCRAPQFSINHETCNCIRRGPDMIEVMELLLNKIARYEKFGECTLSCANSFFEKNAAHFLKNVFITVCTNDV